jgi:ketosteroid isomerase-like protein
MDAEVSIRRAAAELDDALEAADVERVVACFAPDCEIELLGVVLHGHDGVRRWLDWVFTRVERIEFSPRVIAVTGTTFIEEFGVSATLPDGRRLSGRWAELLSYRAGLVASLRLYFDPLEFAAAMGPLERAGASLARRRARRGLEPFEELRPTSESPR